MNTAVEDLVAICRIFGLFERNQVCCGTVTVQQCVTLQALLDGPVEVGPLAERVGNSASAMTRLVDGLVRHEWVSRVRDGEDRRKVRVALTDAGRAEAERLRAATDFAVRAVLSAVPEDKREQVVESVGLLRRAMETASEAVAGC